MAYELGTIEEYGVEFEISMWKVSDILKKVTISSDYNGEFNTIEFDGTPSTWAYLIASKAGDYHTPTLALKILEEGFTDPICIWRDNRGAYGLGNGHHRLVCAILLGLDEIPVVSAVKATQEHYPDASDGDDINVYDSEVADKLYKIYTKIYKKLAKQELVELDEESNMR